MREWLASIVGESLAPIMTVILAAALVVLLALVLIGLAKRVFAGSGGIGGRSRAPRLAVLDMAPIDPKRKLVLVRRDDVEHLILIGGQNDLVVEPGIVRGQARRPRQEPGFAEAEQRTTPPQAPLPHRRTPRPAVQPMPDDGQEPGAHAPIAPVAEASIAPTPEARVYPASRASAVAADRTEPHRGPAVVPPTAPVAPAQRSEPTVMPPAPVVAPPVAAPAASAPAVSRATEDAPPARPAEPRLSPEPVPASPRAQDAVAEPVAPPLSAVRPTLPGSSTESAPRRPDAPPAMPERVEPVFTPAEPTRAASAEPTRAAPIAPPVQPQRPVAPPIAQTVTPTATIPAPTAPTQNVPPARPTTPPAPPVAQVAPPVQAPSAPRSMATPTLPQMSRANPMPSQPRDEAETTASRSLWSTAPSVTVSPLPGFSTSDAGDRAERDPVPPSVSPTAMPMPERVPVRWPSAPLAPRTDSAAKTEVGFGGPAADGPEPSPAPLSVKSFATTIQERRTPSATDVVAPPAPAPRPPVAPPVAEAAPIAAPVSAPPVPPRGPDGAEAREGERPLTLEEEMERLLHDFTIDVSERR